MSRAKRLHLLEDPEVKCWYQNIARDSRITVDAPHYTSEATQSETVRVLKEEYGLEKL
ncbi:MAG: hypothetical protein ACUVTM_05560 [Candidatus Bathyarchaeia archaeon]